MKKILFLLIGITSYSQSLPELIKEYEKHCNETVLDTIRQSGSITERMIKVEGTDYYAVALDTVWNEPSIPEYKHYAYDTSSAWVKANNVAYTYTDISTLQTGGIPGSEKAKERSRYIERDYVCEVKRRKILPFSDHFWEWIKNKG